MAKTLEEAYLAAPIPNRVAFEMYVNLMRAMPLILMLGPRVLDLMAVDLAAHIAHTIYAIDHPAPGPEEESS